MSENKNDQVIVALFPSTDAADQAVEALKAWDQAADDVKLGAVGTLIIGEDGMLKTHVGHKAGKGAKTGAILGVIAGVFTGGLSVVAGLVGGAALGGGLGSFLQKSTNLTEAEINKIIVELKTGKAGVVVTCDEDELEPTKAELTKAGGTIWVYEMSPAEMADAAAAAQTQAEIDRKIAEAGTTAGGSMEQAARWSQAV
jgi:hypothetical protein